MRLLIIIIILTIAGCNNEKKEDGISAGGYFKGHTKNRIFTVKIQSWVMADDAYKYAQKAAHTTGKITAMYFYDKKNIPVDGITYAKSYGAANYILYDLDGMDDWRYAYLKTRSGSEMFIDCQKNPNNGLCKQQ